MSPPSRSQMLAISLTLTERLSSGIRISAMGSLIWNMVSSYRYETGALVVMRMVMLASK